VNPLALLEQQFGANRAGLDIVYRHSRMVADKALALARGARAKGLDLEFIEQAALLHDIGVSAIYAPQLHCFGKAPYICHASSAGKSSKPGVSRGTALVCERHIGVGLSQNDIATQKLPLPDADVAARRGRAHRRPCRPLLLQEGRRLGTGRKARTR